MKKTKIKEQWNRFRQWQQTPPTYSFSTKDTHHCVNCGHEFEGNFCPCCGQKHDMGPVTWKSLWQEFLNVWGMGGRSMLYSLWQLLWRPGYFISDYINGRRQVSFPPVKMMFIVALFYVLMQNYVLPEDIVQEKIKTDTHDILQPFFDFMNWTQSHQDWGTLVVSVLLILPTWFFFRESPRNTRHTIPQGFFIQVLLSTMGMIFSLLTDVVKPIAVVKLLWGIIAFKQLFGYGWWGTIWRTGMVYVSTLCMGVTLAAGYDIMHGLFTADSSLFWENVGVVLIFLTFTYYLVGIGYFFTYHPRAKFGTWGTVWRTVVALLLPFVVMFLTMIIYSIVTEGWDAMWED